MSKQFWRMIALTVAAILTSLILIVGQTLLATAAMPKQQTIAQVTSVSQFLDLNPAHYYYPATQSLVEEYGCVASNPDGTFRPDRPLQSAEFVGILSACMDRVGELFATVTSDSPTREDFNTTQRLLREIATEVSSMRR